MQRLCGTHPFWVSRHWGGYAGQRLGRTGQGSQRAVARLCGNLAGCVLPACCPCLRPRARCPCSHLHLHLHLPTPAPAGLCLCGTPAPSPAGFLASATYQALYTLPNYDRLVGQPLAASHASPATVAALLLLFGCLFNLHTVLQAAVFKSDGAIGVGLVNAVRGAAITGVIAALFCGPGKQHLCLTRQTVLSAAITTAGGAVYVLAGGQPRPAPVAVRKTGRPAAAAAAARAGAAAEKDKAA